MNSGSDSGAQYADLPFGREISEIIKRIEISQDSSIKNIAVISEPYAGDYLIINGLHDILKERVCQHKFGSVQYRHPEKTEICPDKDIVILEGCHYLFSRRIGGYENLTGFLREISSDERIYITFWNVFAWNYISAATGADSYFQDAIRIKPAEPDMLMEIIRRESESKTEYIDDRPKSDRKRIYIDWHEKKLPYSEKTVPFPKPVYESNVGEVLTGSDAEEYAFERIAAISGGNLGVAKKLWRKSVHDNQFRLSGISSRDSDISLNYNGSYILLLIITWGALSEKEITEMTGSEDSVAKLFELTLHGIIFNEGGRYSIDPLRFVQARDYLKRIRLVW
jgi:hypothetical protein